MNTKVLFVIIDGFGIDANKKGNAVTHARMLFFQKLLKQYPHTQLHAAGKYVGLLDGYIGNSEVGHLHIGAGRLVRQDLRRIFDAIHDQSFFTIPEFVRAINHVKKTNGTLHVMGLLSDAGVHSHHDHLFAVLKLAKQRHVKTVAVHAFLDGRDVPPQSAEKYLKRTKAVLTSINPRWRIATLSGRFYAMDRDNRWHRTRKAYNAFTSGRATHTSEIAALRAAYDRLETDEFVAPVRLTDDAIKGGDSVIFFNYRADRARQLTHAFVDKKFRPFRRKRIENLCFVTMTNYEEKLPVNVAFPAEHVHNSIGEIVARKGLRQFRLAETEKWAHVTFFFNGLSDTVFKGEDRLLVQSPKVRTYDKTPEMSAGRVTTDAIKRLNRNYSLMVVNYANPDMVGHTGKFKETVQANEFTDKCLAKLVPAAQQAGYTVIITADHGNAEQMLHSNGQPCTSHTTHDVPFILCDKRYNLHPPKDAALYHVAPTILDLMHIKKPREMLQRGLI